ncbi:MAG: succinylglutamate desuccinylase/aspartoacylase family protein [Chthoniobacter sp.]|uniref:succinylglutamate desuccinylase/aspartoacylase domain-containing protein n=1 Tax=Chthoniobacter sp. TaxID=2510640 RepID=UPI0032A8EC33
MSHRAHDYRHLVERWRTVARKSGVPLRRLVRADGYEHFYLRTPALAQTGGIYFSAGIHGDEAAATEALITWAEQQGKKLRHLPLLLLPCLNPWGLVQNIRLNRQGADLNRGFDRTDLPVVEAVKRVVAGHQFEASVMLHEDYDGQGIYLYEIQRVQPHWGEALLKAARKHLPTDPRIWIDGRKTAKGIHRRRIDKKRFEQIGYPEAVWLHFEHSERTFTVETPSEFALERRVAAHIAVIEEVVLRVVG